MIQQLLFSLFVLALCPADVHGMDGWSVEVTAAGGDLVWTPAVPNASLIVGTVDVLKLLQEQSLELQAARSELRATRTQLCPSAVHPFLTATTNAGATDHATHVEYFSYGGQHFLALANNAGTMSPVFLIQRSHDNSVFDLTVAHQLPTTGAYDIEFFVHPSTNKPCLAVANLNNGATYNLDSVLYCLNNATQQFEEMQRIPTNGAAAFEYFVIDGVSYLAVANYHDDQSQQINSAIYKYQPALGQFALSQHVSTSGAVDVEHFAVGLAQFLVFANSVGPSSPVLRFNTTSQLFAEVQTLSTVGAYDVEVFVIGSRQYLAFANYVNGATRNIDSFVYRLTDPDAPLFEQLQAIPTIGAVQWTHFVTGTGNYLAVANQLNDQGSTFKVNSTVFRFDSAKDRFFKVAELPTSGADSITKFDVNGTSALAVAQHHNDATGNLQVGLFEINPLCT